MYSLPPTPTPYGDPRMDMPVDAMMGAMPYPYDALHGHPLMASPFEPHPPAPPVRRYWLGPRGGREGGDEPAQAPKADRRPMYAAAPRVVGPLKAPHKPVLGKGRYGSRWTVVRNALRACRAMRMSLKDVEESSEMTLRTVGASLRMDPLPPSATERLSPMSLARLPYNQENWDQARAECVAEVRKIIDQCRKDRKRYVDEEFERYFNPNATDAARSNHGEMTDNCDWMRLQDIAKDPFLFVDGTLPGDVLQGRTGSCWILGAAAVLSVHGSLLPRLFAAFGVNEGVYGIMLYDKDLGMWDYEIIDDYVPVAHNRPINAKCADSNELWVPLLEKAFAKRRGGYGNINGGFSMFALIEMTGGRGRHLKTRSDIVFDNMKYNADNNITVFAASYSSEKNSKFDKATGAYTIDGIIRGHAYAVLRLVCLSTGQQLVELRNPWGSMEYVGKWSDESDLWTPELLRELGHSLGDDGTFYMEWDAFKEIFEFVDAVDLPGNLREYSFVADEHQQDGVFHFSQGASFYGHGPVAPSNSRMFLGGPARGPHHGGPHHGGPPRQSYTGLHIRDNLSAWFGGRRY